MHFYLVCNMNKIGSVFVIYLLAVAATGTGDLKSKIQARNEQASQTKVQTTKTVPTNHISAHAVANDGMIGVASIAGVDSRNGRVSSISGFKLFPPIDSSMVKTDNKGNFIFKSDGKMSKPITITKQGDGVSGTIRIMPGSVSVSSSSNSGSALAGIGPQIPDFGPWPIPFMKPMMNDIFFPDLFPAFPSISNSRYRTRIPDSAFHTIPEPSFPRMTQPAFPWRMQDLWMDKDMFKQSIPMPSMLRHNWYYPDFRPFENYW